MSRPLIIVPKNLLLDSPADSASVGLSLRTGFCRAIGELSRRTGSILVVLGLHAGVTKETFGRLADEVREFAAAYCRVTDIVAPAFYLWRLMGPDEKIALADPIPRSQYGPWFFCCLHAEGCDCWAPAFRIVTVALEELQADPQTSTMVVPDELAESAKATGLNVVSPGRVLACAGKGSDGQD